MNSKGLFSVFPLCAVLSQVLDDEHDFSDRDTDVEDSLELGAVWAEEEDMLDTGMSTPIQQSMHHILQPPQEPSGRETPVSVDSIPLEWDHTVDVGGSSSPEDEDEEEATYYSALSGIQAVILKDLFSKNLSIIYYTHGLSAKTCSTFEVFFFRFR